MIKPGFYQTDKIEYILKILTIIEYGKSKNILVIILSLAVEKEFDRLENKILLKYMESLVFSRFS